MFDITFNGHTAREILVAVARRPSVPAPQPRGEWVGIGGRDGSFLVEDGTYENIEIEVELNFCCPRDKVGIQYRRVKNWLHGAGELSFSDDSDVFYKVKQCAVTDFARRAKQGADLVATFACDPFAYHDTGRYEYPVADVQFNPGFKCYPVYHIAGTSSGGTLSVNGNSVNFDADIHGGIYIDTEKMFCYDAYGANLNRKVTGDIGKLYLVPGVNSITPPASPYVTTVTPNWRSL